MRILAFGIALTLAAPAAPVAEFATSWKDRGRSLASSKPWLSEHRILVLVEPDVAGDLGPKVADAIREQLKALGSSRLIVAWSPLPREAFGPCQKDGVMDSSCFDLAVAGWRRKDAQAERSILIVVTNAALGSLMKRTPGGSSGPPAGRASWPDGWAVLSEYYLRLNTGKLEPKTWAAFSAHARAHTAKHELIHILGLPHHEAIPNPGLPEPPVGDACRHVVGGPTRTECLMRCGSGDDDWGHLKTHGRGFGLCARCQLAAESALAGVEGR